MGESGSLESGFSGIRLSGIRGFCNPAFPGTCGALNPIFHEAVGGPFQIRNDLAKH